MTEFEKAIPHYASATEPGTYAHLTVTRTGKMRTELNKTKEQNDEARFFCKNVVPLAASVGKPGNISLHISIGSDGSHEVFYGGSDE